MKVAALISGGKDSILALHKVAEENEVSYLISAIPEKEDSWMFHTACLEMIDVVAECLNLPLKKIPVSGEKEKEVDEFTEGLKYLDVEAICLGVIESSYQYRRATKICEKLKLKLLTPLWKVDQMEILKEVAEKFEAIIVSVSAEGLDEHFLGKRIDFNLIEKLKKLRINPAGEGGEYETLVLDAPLYKKKIFLESFDVTWKNFSGKINIKKFKLINKNKSFFTAEVKLKNDES
ncbi:MAG: TIGR00289 family protein [Archaeoglobaceae archaeon]|nr:TIGR00289 family protein [Archaeoglobaceae archaeon]MCX8151492.1 TIGR00289 family protein [Archaeoglobaceae archaeon]MDW8014254.1 TIGR00289 family protein [Archaeoglobaceae archaeon]